jgi:hypothetical protein
MSGRLILSLWWSRQEDAQEFLSYVMDRMHEELLKLETSPTEAPPAKAGNGPLANGAAGGAGEGDDEWETVGPKNKSAVTRMHTHSESALSSIFGGSLQSLVKTKGEGAWWGSSDQHGAITCCFGAHACALVLWIEMMHPHLMRRMI